MKGFRTFLISMLCTASPLFAQSIAEYELMPGEALILDAIDGKELAIEVMYHRLELLSYDADKLRELSETGDSSAQYKLSHVIRQKAKENMSDTVEAEALWWLQVSAEQGFASAAAEIAVLWMTDGDEFVSNKYSAEQIQNMLLSAANKGSILASAALLYFYVEPTYTGKVDPVKAVMWWEVFKSRNIEAAYLSDETIRSLEAIKQQMSPDDQLLAKGLADLCVQQKYRNCDY